MQRRNTTTASALRPSFRFHAEPARPWWPAAGAGLLCALLAGCAAPPPAAAVPAAPPAPAATPAVPPAPPDTPATMAPAAQPATPAADAALPSAEAEQAGFAEWIAGFRQEALQAGIRPEAVAAALDGAQWLPQVIELDRSQPEFTRTPWAYLDSAVSPTRIQRGRDALAEQRAALDSAAARYGVPAEVITAIWGMESNYGSNFGTFRTVDALATLAYEGPPPRLGARRTAGRAAHHRPGRHRRRPHDRLLGRRHGPHPVPAVRVPGLCSGRRWRRPPRHLGQRPGRRRIHGELPVAHGLAAGPALGRGSAPAAGLRLRARGTGRAPPVHPVGGRRRAGHRWPAPARAGRRIHPRARGRRAARPSWWGRISG